MRDEGAGDDVSVVSRRSVVKRIGAGTALAWSAPALFTVSPAGATGEMGTPPPCEDPPECAHVCRKIRHLKAATNAFLDDLLEKGADPADIAELRALANSIFDSVLKKLGCCP